MYVLERGGPSHVQAFLHAVLFPSVRLLVVLKYIVAYLNSYDQKAAYKKNMYWHVFVAIKMKDVDGVKWNTLMGSLL